MWTVAHKMVVLYAASLAVHFEKLPFWKPFAASQLLTVNTLPNQCWSDRRTPTFFLSVARPRVQGIQREWTFTRKVEALYGECVHLLQTAVLGLTLKQIDDDLLEWTATVKTFEIVQNKSMHLLIQATLQQRWRKDDMKNTDLKACGQGWSLVYLLQFLQTFCDVKCDVDQCSVCFTLQ